jgi:hypothetical protein
MSYDDDIKEAPCEICKQPVDLRDNEDGNDNVEVTPTGYAHAGCFRATFAEAALWHYLSGNDLETAVGDLLCDLMHFADRKGVNFADALARGRGHHDDEI